MGVQETNHISEPINPLSVAIEDFLNERAEKDEEDLLKGSTKKPGFAKRLEDLIQENHNLLGQKDAEIFDKIKKIKKDKDQSKVQFQREKYQCLVQLADKVNIVGREKIYDECDNAIADNKRKHRPSVWLTKNCKDASCISIATHVAKLTHSSIKGASNILDSSQDDSERFLSTASLTSTKRPRDYALDSAAYAPIASFLNIERSGLSLYDAVMDGDTTPFARFSDEKAQVQDWVSNLRQASQGARKRSHMLAKQVYWPLGDMDRYHLLVLLKSSSIVQRLYLEFSDDSREKAKEQRRKGKYSPEPCVYYPDKAVIRVTASNHLNASNLNQQRFGKINLLPCCPPQWQSRLTPPVNRKYIFSCYEIAENTKNLTNQLQKYLLALKLNQASINKPQIHRHIRALVESIATEVFDYAAAVRQMKDCVGWSKNSRMKTSHRIFLDPYRDDEEFIALSSGKEWQRELCNDFAEWLNNRLKNKSLKLGPIQAGLWRDIFSPQLRLFLADMEGDMEAEK